MSTATIDNIPRNSVYNFFFEPAQLSSVTLKVAAYATQFFLTIATLGLWLIPLFLVSTLSSRKITSSGYLAGLDLKLKEVVENSPVFKGYAITMDESSPYFGATLTSVACRPANIFLSKLFAGTDIQHTLPGSGKLFAFNQPQRTIRTHIQTKLDLAPDTVIEVNVQGVQAAVVLRDKKLLAPLEEIFGRNTYRISLGEVEQILNSQKVYVSPSMPVRFYFMLKSAFERSGIVTLPGNDSNPCKLKDIPFQEVRNVIDWSRGELSELGFNSREEFENLLNKTLYQLGSLVVKTEDYHCFLDGDGKIREREVGGKDAIRLINACGIRGIRRTPDEDNIKIMTEAFSTALVAAEKDMVVFPAVGMGVWRGDPQLYWSAFFEAVANSATPFTHIFVNPRHQPSAAGKYTGCKGEECAEVLKEFLEKYKDDAPKLANLKKIVNLYEGQQDLVQLALNLKKAYPDKIISLFNASDPDVTFGNHVGEYVNNVPHTTTTEENYTAMGTNGLCFEGITRALTRDRLFQVKNNAAVSWNQIHTRPTELVD